MSYKTVKKSCGIALCRYTDKFQILMVKKRYSYSYADFVAGKYSCADENKISSLFSGMTSEEKMEIESNNFSQMWYRIWRYNPEIENCSSKERGNYNIAKKKYISTSKKHDLIEMLNNTKISDCIWDIPKGRINKEEKDITCNNFLIK